MRSDYTRRSLLVGVAASMSVALYSQADLSFGKTELIQPSADGKKPDMLEGSLQLHRGSKRVLFFVGNTKRFEVEIDSIRNLVYERAKRPRYAAGVIAWPLFFTKTKKHYFTIQYEDQAGEGQYTLFQLHKNNYRDILAAFEAACGMKIQRMEES